MSQDEFTKLFKYSQRRFDAIDERLEQTATKDDLRKLIAVIDAQTKVSETYMQEFLALSHKVERLEQG